MGSLFAKEPTTVTWQMLDLTTPRPVGPANRRMMFVVPASETGCATIREMDQFQMPNVEEVLARRDA